MIRSAPGFDASGKNVDGDVPSGMQLTGHGLVTLWRRTADDSAAYADLEGRRAGRGLVVSRRRGSPSPGPSFGPGGPAATAYAGASRRRRGATTEAVDREPPASKKPHGNVGFAIGTASAFPMSVDRIARWAAALESKGIELVPVSALAEGPR